MAVAVTLDVDLLPLHGDEGLFEVLGRLPDVRKRRGKRHSLASILALATGAVLCGSRSLQAIAQWIAEQSSQTRKRLGSKYGHPVSESTLRRVFRQVDMALFDRAVGAWCARHELAGKGLALDGKTLRGSAEEGVKAVHLVSVVTHEETVVVAQHRVEDKTNEITSVEPVLRDLDLTGAVLTGDAMFAQRAIATYVVETKHADYVFTVKDNQPTLRQDIQDLHLEGAPPPTRRSTRATVASKNAASG